eukprot:GFYU01004185.1.p1 GENE.GFYU01004185.1~~GFYU01004185.1.p1  ORF type:complete len:219 (-),score=31.17 GFYU01004185.1:156-812(-)
MSDCDSFSDSEGSLYESDVVEEGEYQPYYLEDGPKRRRQDVDYLTYEKCRGGCYRRFHNTGEHDCEDCGTLFCAPCAETSFGELCDTCDQWRCGKCVKKRHCKCERGDGEEEEEVEEGEDDDDEVGYDPYYLDDAHPWDPENEERVGDVNWFEFAKCRGGCYKQFRYSGTTDCDTCDLIFCAACAREANGETCKKCHAWRCGPCIKSGQKCCEDATEE